MNLSISLFGLASLLVASTAFPAEKKGVSASARMEPEGIVRMLKETFTRWDEDRNGKLERKELAAAIENPSVRGWEAAIAVQIFESNFDPREPMPVEILTLSYLTEQARSAAFVKGVNKRKDRLDRVTRTIFLPSDPNLAALKQGGIGDCYLVAPIAAAVARDPKAIRSLIQPDAAGQIRVEWRNGKSMTIPRLTDAELMRGAAVGVDRGIWLNVMEKAYGMMKEERWFREQAGEMDDQESFVARDFLGGGRCAPVIQALTGNRTGRLNLNKTKTMPDAEDKVHDLLQQLVQQRRLIVCGGGPDPRPPRTPSGHAYAVLGYDQGRRLVQVMNPWGHDFTPKGSPGLKEGYLTRNGRFTIPLKEFIALFGNIVYETQRPLKLGVESNRPEELMKKTIIKPWQSETKMVLPHSGPPVEQSVMAAIYRVETRAYTLEFPIMAATHPKTKKTHILPANDQFYIRTDVGYIAGSVLGNSVRWAWGHVFSTKDTAAAIAMFDAKVSGRDLLEADSARPATFLKELSNDFFAASPGSSALGIPVLKEARVKRNQLQLDLKSPTGEYEATVWIDLTKRKVLKAEQANVKRTKP